jgi:phospholipase C
MDGFNMERGGACNKRKNPNCPFEYPPYAYVPHDEIRPYLEMAEQYVVANEMYTSDFDLSSFELNQFLIAAVDTGDTYDDPTGPWGCSGRRDSDRIKLLPAGPPPHKTTFPCWNATTLGDELDSANVTWAYYAVGPVSPDTSAYQAIKHIYKGPDWTEDVFSPPSKFLKDISGGELRNVTWITPTYKDSDAAGSGSSSGPSWVASLVNAIGKSRFWDSTAIFISWDGAGGWYDPNAPQNLDLDGLGFRVPLLVISPYAKKGYISHVHYETGSLLRFVEERYALASLGASDSRATSPAVDCFDFNKRPRKFVPIR